MARVDTLKNFLTDVADKFRQKLGTTDKISHADFDAKIDEVYSKGAQSEYDRFWDIYQNNGTETVYQNMFGGKGWTNSTFKPKYDMVPINASRMFANNVFGFVPTDLVKVLQNCGVVLDFSQCTSVVESFYYSFFTRIGELDFSSAQNCNSAFGYCQHLHTIDKLVVHESLTFSNTFSHCSKLENLTIEGTIGQNGFDVQHSTKLSSESIISIINALSDTKANLSVTLSLEAVNSAFETAEGASDGSTAQAWTELVASKPNWTISLI